MKQSFLNFANLIPSNGYLIICDDDKNTHYIYDKVDCNIIRYGLNNTDIEYSALNLSFNEQGYPSFDLYIKGIKINRVTLGMQGRHNVLNVLSAIATCHLLGGDIKGIVTTIKTLSGAKRRLDIRADNKGIKVIADYAHHPTEIDVTLETINNIEHNEIWAVFEPHTYSRLRVLYNDFITCFKYADHVIMADVYNDREKEDPLNNSKNLARDIKKQGQDAIYLPSYEKIKNHLIQNMKKGDIIMILGSKYIEGIANQLADYLNG